MTADDLMLLIGQYALMCDELRSPDLHAQIKAEVTRLHAEAAKSERRAPTVEEAFNMGTIGSRAARVPHSEAERLAFESWMSGHCWALCATWRGEQYVSDEETNGNVSMNALVTRRLWAAWRDRAALEFRAERPAP